MMDVDGVLAEYMLPYTTLLAQLSKSHVFTPYGHRDSLTWDPECPSDVGRTEWSMAQSSAQDIIRYRPNWWATLPVLASKADVSAVHKLSYETDLYFVTSRFGDGAKLDTEFWIRHHLEIIPTVIITGITARKGRFASAIDATHMLDDKPQNLMDVQWSSEADGRLLKMPYNSPHSDLGPGAYVESVEEFVEWVLS